MAAEAGGRGWTICGQPPGGYTVIKTKWREGDNAGCATERSVMTIWVPAGSTDSQLGGCGRWLEVGPVLFRTSGLTSIGQPVRGAVDERAVAAREDGQRCAVGEGCDAHRVRPS